MLSFSVCCNLVSSVDGFDCSTVVLLGAGALLKPCGTSPTEVLAGPGVAGSHGRSVGGGGGAAASMYDDGLSTWASIAVSLRKLDIRSWSKN